MTVTAKIWFVSDFNGKYSSRKLAKVDQNCKDVSEGGDTRCDLSLTYEYSEIIPESVRDSWDEDTPKNRAQATVDKSLDYMNDALANSEIPMRYVQWGSVQDIGKTEAQIGSGYSGPGTLVNDLRESDDVFKRYNTINVKKFKLIRLSLNINVFSSS